MQYYDNAISAAQFGIDYWTNVENFIIPNIQKEALVKYPQATPLSLETIRSVVRPKDVDKKKWRTDAYVRKIRGEQEPGDDGVLNTIFGLSNG